jgi:hypothetical protein
MQRLDSIAAISCIYLLCIAYCSTYTGRDRSALKEPLSAQSSSFFRLRTTTLESS